MYLIVVCSSLCFFFFFQAEDGIRDVAVTGVQTCALPIYPQVGQREGFRCHARSPEGLAQCGRAAGGAGHDAAERDFLHPGALGRRLEFGGIVDVVNGPHPRYKTLTPLPSNPLAGGSCSRPVISPPLHPWDRASLLTTSDCAFRE